MAVMEPRGAAAINFNAFKAIVPNDFVPIAQQPGAAKYAAALFVGTGGNISVVGTDGIMAVFKNVPSGTLLPVHVVTVNATGTTAADIVALYRV